MPRDNPLAGVAQVAIGRARGLDRFGRTVPAFLASLAPLLAFPIAGALIELFRDGPETAVSLILIALVAQLTPPVLSHALAARWGREEEWLRYATAYNWCYWALPVVLMALMLVFGTAAGAGLPQMTAAQGVVAGVAAYSLWLHWFLGRHALDLSRLRAVLLVILVNAVTAALVLGPALLS